MDLYSGISLAPGDVVDGRFEILERVGSGAHAVVFKCVDRLTPTLTLGMKVMVADIRNDRSRLTRFCREVRALRTIDHPHIVRCYDVVQSDAVVGFTMDYVEGTSLRELLAIHSALPVFDVVAILLQLCSGLSAVHHRRLVHRDLKPDNILLTSDRVLKIADFGVANDLLDGLKSASLLTWSGSFEATPEAQSDPTTQAGAIVGTLGYFGPEYFKEGTVDHRADLYAVGIIGYELLTGKHPYGLREIPPIAVLHRQTDPGYEIPDAFPNDMPAALKEFLAKALAPDPSQRHGNAQQMLAALMGIYGQLERLGSPRLGLVSGTAYAMPMPPPPSEHSFFEDLRARLFGSFEYRSIVIPACILVAILVAAIGTSVSLGGVEGERKDSLHVEANIIAPVAATSPPRFFAPAKGEGVIRSIDDAKASKRARRKE